MALLVSGVMALAVWVTVSQYLVLQRERSTAAQVVDNADDMQRDLQSGGLPVPDVLAQLSREIGSTSVVVVDDEWYTTSLQIGRDDLPQELREAVLQGQASRQRIDVDGRTVLATGVPLAEGGAYFEVFPVGGLLNALRLMAGVLVAATVLVPVVALPLGWWATRPALRPLGRLSQAAAAVAQGDLGARIDPRGDPELVPIADSFNVTAAALEDRVRADARFAADVAHELRTPLTTMRSAAALADEYGDRLPDDGREALSLLRAEVERFSQLVQDLLEISRADAAGHPDLALAPVNLAELVMWSVPPERRSRLVVAPEAVDLHVTADKRRLERVVANLVANAELHGGGLVEVTVGCVDGWAQVQVDDAGPGVPTDERARIFERFTRGQATPRGSTDGAGLGLAMVTRHMHQLGGEVRVEDSPHGGARFVVSLPLDRPG